MLVYAQCQYLSSLFFQEITHNESFSVFPRGEVGKLKFLCNSQIGPYSLMSKATSPISNVASFTSIPLETCCSLMLDVLKGLEFKTFLAFNVISMEQATPGATLYSKKTDPSRKPNGSVFQKGFASFKHGSWNQVVKR